MIRPLPLPMPLVWILLWLLALVIAELLLQRIPRIQRRWVNLVRWLVFPYVALLTGAVSPRLMGLTMIDWPTSLGMGLPLVAGFGILFAVIRMTQGPVAAITYDHPLLAPISAGAEEFSWSFLRAAWWESLLVMAAPISLPAYWATWLAGLVALPDLLRNSHQGTARVTRLALLGATSVVYIYTRNFWLCWILHTGVTLTFLGHGLQQRTPNDGEQQGDATAANSKAVRHST